VKEDDWQQAAVCLTVPSVYYWLTLSSLAKAHFHTTVTSEVAAVQDRTLLCAVISHMTQASFKRRLNTVSDALTSAVPHWSDLHRTGELFTSSICYQLRMPCDLHSYYKLWRTTTYLCCDVTSAKLQQIHTSDYSIVQQLSLSSQSSLRCGLRCMSSSSSSSETKATLWYSVLGNRAWAIHRYCSAYVNLAFHLLLF